MGWLALGFKTFVGFNTGAIFAFFFSVQESVSLLIVKTLLTRSNVMPVCRSVF